MALLPTLVASGVSTAIVKAELMGLTASQKQACYNLCDNAVIRMSGAEYLRATIAQASAYGAATDPAAVAPTLITEMQNYRVANGSPTVTLDVGFNIIDLSLAQTAAKLG